MTRPGTSLTRLTDLGNAVDEWARLGGDFPADLAIRHAIEGLTRTAQAFPQTADAIELYVQRMAEVLGVEGP